METRGKITGLQVAYRKAKACISLEVQARPEDLEKYLGIDDLDITIVQHREKRSLDANACLWRCLGQIADALRADKWEVYLQALRKYGQYTYILVRPRAVEALKKQWRECMEVGEVDVNGTKAVQMLCFYGSSMYNSREFAVLLDGVISDMKDLGLEPPLPADVRKALAEMERKERDKTDRQAQAGSGQQAQGSQR